MQFAINPFTHRLDAFEQTTTGAGQVEFLTGDSGGAVSPDALHNINIVGGPGIDIVGTPGTNTLTVSLNGSLEATAQTIGATTTAMFTFPYPVRPGTYLFKADVVGFDIIGQWGTSFVINATIRATNVGSVFILKQIVNSAEEGGTTTTDSYILANPANAILLVSGAAGRTINWKALMTSIYVG